MVKETVNLQKGIALFIIDDNEPLRRYIVFFTSAQTPSRCHIVFFADTRMRYAAITINYRIDLIDKRTLYCQNRS